MINRVFRKIPNYILNVRNEYLEDENSKLKKEIEELKSQLEDRQDNQDYFQQMKQNSMELKELKKIGCNAFYRLKKIINDIEMEFDNGDIK